MSSTFIATTILDNKEEQEKSQKASIMSSPSSVLTSYSFTLPSSSLTSIQTTNSPTSINASNNFANSSSLADSVPSANVVLSCNDGTQEEDSASAPAKSSSINCSILSVEERAADTQVLLSEECCFREFDMDTVVKPKVNENQGKEEADEEIGGRAIRSNSCSQADVGAKCCIAGVASAAAAAAASGCVSSAASSVSLVCVSRGAELATTSVSQENLTSTTPLTSSASVSNINLPDCISTSQHLCHNQPQPIDQAGGCSAAEVQQQQQQKQQQEKQQQQSSTSRFFSSKLNTGSLWSLLSNSSYTSETPLNDNMETTDAQQENKSNVAGGFFSRVQFKRSNTQDQQSQKATTEASGQQPVQSVVGSAAGTERKRLRFSVKYMGSTILHKNFTLPMLEWIARDIKRQTIRGAQSTSQRQFNIPSRDIIFEIQAYKLTAISCKDGHAIFVHPMHCVSKYAQLQHDPTCFSYLIRDTKESPYYCHVFQAKNASKVHDIFSAIRETTTSSCVTPLLNADALSAAKHSNLQKSFSSEGPLKSLISGSSTDNRSAAAPTRHSGNTTPLVATNQPNALLAATPTVAQANKPATAQFEDSYQFEVMFVKKVKLQCRRVPPTFVDDALETLKSFEVLKGGDSKGGQMKGLGKRIISASVDERQEYDEACQSPTPQQQQVNHKLAPISAESSSGSSSSNVVTEAGEERRGSSASLHRLSESTIKEERESRSCQQSPTKQQINEKQSGENKVEEQVCPSQTGCGERKKHQSMECLKCIDYTIQSAKAGNAPTYMNDFSPYNTITSSDLNERIAAIPVVSSSVSLDHETRQKLARQVRETIMATAANIKKNVHASGDKLNSSSSSKALDSLSCTVTSSVPPPIDDNELLNCQLESEETSTTTTSKQASGKGSQNVGQSEQRRSSALASSIYRQQQEQQSSGQTSNNFDLFRRASARQVIKNRTMLLLIGKDELCTISTDKHQMLFNKSFNSIVLCLQGNTNRDHFGLICRDSGKINPNTESYAGFIFKCHSDKVAREIMSALKQVIYNSQHNYHGYNSPYNPLNAKFNKPDSPKMARSNSNAFDAYSNQQVAPSNGGVVGQITSLAAKRGFLNSIDLDEATRLSASFDNTLSITPPTGSYLQPNSPAGLHKRDQAGPVKNIIKSMFCDNCPLYWYHRLCCDIESLPAEASKAIILRRIESSLSEKEQDEVYSKFSEFNIDTIDEHNEIFMSLLRQLAEKKQLKHIQSSSHQSEMAKNSALLKQQMNTPTLISSMAPAKKQISSTHQRSGSTSGSSTNVMSHLNSGNQSVADASFAAIDNLKKAKNSISVSIENILKRRSSGKDEQDELVQTIDNHANARTGSFRSTSRGVRLNETSNVENSTEQNAPTALQRSQSTTDHSRESNCSSSTRQMFEVQSGISWKGSLSNTLNREDISNQLAGLFSRRGSISSSRENKQADNKQLRTSTDCLNFANSNNSPNRQPGSPNAAASRFLYCNQDNGAGSSSPSSMLSSAFWKKSIFDKIRQPLASREESEQQLEKQQQRARLENEHHLKDEGEPKKRTSEELRALWRKAVLEQITLIKMDKQNLRLQATAAECDSHRIKLNYRDIPYSREVLSSWDILLKQDPTKKVEFFDVARLVRSGVPKQRRGEVWMFLMNQYQLRHGTSFQPAGSDYKGDANQAYRSLLSQLSLQQHEIFVDIGRTFPSHPYYSQYLSIGQLSLFNLLKSYSLLDQEVGYCQGLSFVAGILLLHVESEDEAFELMRHLLFNFGLRKQYLPSMNALHLQLYQLTRLLRDYEFELFNHFDHYDISPSLYAAPWFLTLFASHFPLGFVSRLLDLVFLIGIEAIFRVSLNLLAYHRKHILNCHSLEATMDYMRSELVRIVDDKNLIQMFDKSMSLDLRNKLIEYEIEYSFYLAEDKSKSAIGQNSMLHKPSAKQESSHDNNLSGSDKEEKTESSTSVVADATATVIIQHILSNNHLKSLKSNYSY